MNTVLPGSTEGHHAEAERLAEALREAARATRSLGDPDLDAVVGGLGAPDVYWASAAFLEDWRLDPTDA